MAFNAANQSSCKPLRVVVADDHHHVLPEFHLAIRKRALPFDSIHVLHFDAHPDLSFPRTLDPSLIYEPEELYNALDESISGTMRADSKGGEFSDRVINHDLMSMYCTDCVVQGIAEFLLPLVYAGHVNQITWIKPHWAQQMPIRAMTRAHVGKNKSTDALCVSLPLAHFLDEDLYAPVEAMDPKSLKQWALFVAELPHDEIASPYVPESSEVLQEAMSELRVSAKGYVLDIDLDYFSTWNPFRKDLEQRVGSSIANVVAQVFCGLQHRDMGNDMNVSARIFDKRAFAVAMEQIQVKRLFLEPDGAECQAILNSSLLNLYPGSTDATQQLLYMFFKILAELDDEARKLVWWAGPNMDLPHHLSLDDEIERMVSAFKAFLVTNGCQNKPPALVTIAKSVGDEYLPPHQVEFVQLRVLSTLSEVFGQLVIEFVEYEKTGEGAGGDE